MDEATNRLNMRNPCHLLATGFGSGLSPKAPGTMGSLAAIPCWFLLTQLPLWLYIVALLISIIGGISLCQRTSDDMQTHDHGSIVWDEFVGMWITLMVVPASLVTGSGTQWLWVIAGFLLFRLFDIWKPWPIRWFDRHVTGGWGIMVDDIVAGIFAAIVLAVVGHYCF